jgi:hypothetical protein
MILGQDAGLEPGYGAVGALQPEYERYSSTRSFNLGPKGMVGQDRWPKATVERWKEHRLDKAKSLTHSSFPLFHHQHT